MLKQTSLSCWVAQLLHFANLPLLSQCECVLLLWPCALALYNSIIFKGTRSTPAVLGSEPHGAAPRVQHGALFPRRRGRRRRRRVRRLPRRRPGRGRVARRALVRHPATGRVRHAATRRVGYASTRGVLARGLCVT